MIAQDNDQLLRWDVFEKNEELHKNIWGVF